MRHGRRKKKLGVPTNHRKALLRNLVKSLVRFKRIRTTVTKAKAASAFADKMITLSKRGDLHSRRTLISYLGCADTVDILIKKIAPYFKSRQGGYTRVLKLDKFRPTDGADMALLEFTEQIEIAKPKKKKASKADRPKEFASEKSEARKSKKADAEENAVEKKKKDKSEAAKSDAEAKKESDKKGGFLGALRKFLKGDEK